MLHVTSNPFGKLKRETTRNDKTQLRLTEMILIFLSWMRAEDTGRRTFPRFAVLHASLINPRKNYWYSKQMLSSRYIYRANKLVTNSSLNLSTEVREITQPLPFTTRSYVCGFSVVAIFSRYIFHRGEGKEKTRASNERRENTFTRREAAVSRSEARWPLPPNKRSV